MSSILPLTFIQAYVCRLLAAGQDDRSVWRPLTLHWAVQVKPTVDSRRLARAFLQLQQRHDVLRLGFAETRAGWRAQLHDAVRAELRIIDCGRCDEAEQHRIVEDHIGCPRDLKNDPLVSLDLFRFEGTGDVILLEVNHLLSDGYGSVLLIEDFLSLFLGLPLGPDPLGFAKYVQTIAVQSPEQIAAGETYWRDLLLPPAAPVNIGFLSKGIDPTENHPGPRQGSVHYEFLDHSALDRINDRARTLECTAFALTVTAFWAAVRDASGAEELQVTTLLGRSDARLEHFAGCHIDMLEMIFRADGGRTISTQAKAIHQQIRKSMGYLPHPATVPDNELVQEIIEQGGHPRRFNVRLANSESRESQSRLAGLLRPSEGKLRLGKYEAQMFPIESSGSTRELAVVQSRHNDGLCLEFAYDCAAFNASEIADLAAHQKTLIQFGE